VSVDVDKYRGFVNLYVDGWRWFVYSGYRCKGCRDCKGKNLFVIWMEKKNRVDKGRFMLYNITDEALF
jgi:hypothetical protein